MAALYLDTDPDVTPALATKPGFSNRTSVVLIGRTPPPDPEVAITGLIEHSLPLLIFRLNVRGSR
jgi:hypothetical protein